MTRTEFQEQFDYKVADKINVSCGLCVHRGKDHGIAGLPDYIAACKEMHAQGVEGCVVSIGYWCKLCKLR